ncbi:DUF433 domain-containing protein [Labrys okinawensis]|uniref:DUF433 domain-containing protein n=1 Tax=Labrys okinawensis TaxID=346911 RepID=UPI0039BCEB4F
MRESWTVAEAAYVLKEPVEVIRKVVERGPVRVRLVHRGRLKLRTVALPDLVYLHAERDLRTALTPKGRAELYNALVKRPAQLVEMEAVAFGGLKLEIKPHLREVESRLEDLNRLADEIDTSTGEPLIKGTDIEAHRIAALLEGGMTLEAVREDYPSLDEDQILAAQIYAELHPKVGRPFPRITAKAAMRNSGLDALDDDS